METLKLVIILFFVLSCAVLLWSIISGVFSFQNDNNDEDIDSFESSNLITGERINKKYK
jgi:hypothetical protein